MDIRDIMYGSVFIAIVTFFVISVICFIKAGKKRTLKTSIVFTVALSFAFFLLLFIPLVLGFDTFTFALFILAFTAPIIFLIQDWIRNAKISNVSKILIAIPVTLTVSVLICLGLFAVDVLFLGGDFP